MKSLVFLLEEQSAEEMLKVFVPRLLLKNNMEASITYIHFNGKQDMEKNLERKIRLWQNNETAFIVLRDQDSGDCCQIKKRLKQICESTGKRNILIRIACHELESFYLGDLNAIQEAFQMKGIAQQQGKAKYRSPDMLPNPVQIMQDLTRGAYQKILGSREIARHLNLEHNESHSFQVLVSGILSIVKK